MKTKKTAKNKVQQEISRALTEVWEWKEAVYKDIEHTDFPQKQQYFQAGLHEAAQRLQAQVQPNADGSYSLVRAAEK